MRIGITYDLRDYYIAQGYKEEEVAEFDRADTIDSIENTLQELGHETDRIGMIKELAIRLAKGDRWDMVFNIAEGLKGFGREAQIPALLDAYDIPYTFSDALTLSLSLHKAMTKHVLRDKKIPTPDFYVVENLSDIGKVELPFPVFAKPVAEGTGKGVNPSSKIKNKNELNEVCKRLLHKYNQPVLVETYLPGREFTVGILGTGEDAKAIGTMEVILLKDAEADVYSYQNKEECEKLVEYRLVQDEISKRAEDIALSSWKSLLGRDAGRVDLRVDSFGNPSFMEVNPLAGLHPNHSDLCIIATMVGMSYKDLINSILLSALKRCHV
ncbi:MAG: ATP-grasp domain-containing protein [Desulfobacterales bacterium]|nr:ATP-grasp domain-containing protein [Desulfobacterales bacterium]MBF0395486.1 ATP-grasp domain-containing protein [Desulfobacterales bacterium]